jgi:hypothetical protein
MHQGDTVLDIDVREARIRSAVGAVRAGPLGSASAFPAQAPA